MHDDRLYIDAAEDRRWHTHLQKNPDVRVRLGGTVCGAAALLVSDSDIVDLFQDRRTIYRLVLHSSKDL